MPSMELRGGIPVPHRLDFVTHPGGELTPRPKRHTAAEDNENHFRRYELHEYPDRRTDLIVDALDNANALDLQEDEVRASSVLNPRFGNEAFVMEDDDDVVVPVLGVGEGFPVVHSYLRVENGEVYDPLEVYSFYPDPDLYETGEIQLTPEEQAFMDQQEDDPVEPHSVSVYAELQPEEKESWEHALQAHESVIVEDESEVLDGWEFASQLGPITVQSDGLYTELYRQPVVPLGMSFKTYR